MVVSLDMVKRKTKIGWQMWKEEFEKHESLVFAYKLKPKPDDDDEFSFRLEVNLINMKHKSMHSMLGGIKGFCFCVQQEEKGVGWHITSQQKIEQQRFPLWLTQHLKD